MIIYAIPNHIQTNNKRDHGDQSAVKVWQVWQIVFFPEGKVAISVLEKKYSSNPVAINNEFIIQFTIWMIIDARVYF